MHVGFDLFGYGQGGLVVKKYRVKVFLSGSKTVEVDAYDKEHARAKAMRSIRFRPEGGHKFICQVDEIKGGSNEE